jgi:hypothetical protein
MYLQHFMLMPQMGSGFSHGQWLCCSLFAPIAHSWPSNLLRLHLIYQMSRKQTW